MYLKIFEVYPIMSPGKGTFYVYINYEEEKMKRQLLHECIYKP